MEREGDSDSALLALVVDRDRGALRRLHERHSPWLVARLRRRCGDADVVAEAIQDTWVAVWRSPSWDGRGEVGAWLWGIAIRRLASLQADVRDRVGEEGLPPRALDLPFSHHQSAFGVARFRLAAALVGVELGPDAPENVLLAGQAPGVVLLWLATRGLDDSEVSAVLTPYDRSSPTKRGHVWPGVCGADLQWAPQDIAAARSLDAADDRTIASVLTAGWARWTSSATPTDELLIAAGLEPLGTPEPIEPLGSLC